MPVPVVSFTQPSQLSSIDMGFKLNTASCIPLKTILTAAADPMLFDQLGTKFAINPIMGLIDKTQLQMKSPHITRDISYVVVNTFPPVYQPATLRPSVGQLYPLNGGIPY